MKSIRLGVLALPLALAGCAASAPAPLPTNAEAWVDCRFPDGAWGHVRLKDCEAGKGSARAPKSGPTITYGMAVEWEGHDGLILGTMQAPEYGLAGSMDFVLSSIGERCNGEFRFTKSPQGVWSFACESGLAASGSFSRYSIDHAISGNGEDSSGNEIEFVAWPPSLEPWMPGSDGNI